MLKNQLLRQIGRIARTVGFVTDARMKEYGLQKGQYYFMTRICENPGISLVDLTEMLCVDKSTTTKAVQKLIEAGYVHKCHPDGNRKTQTVFPTENAKAIYKRIIQEENRAIDISISSLSEEETEQVIALLTRIGENLEKEL